MWSRYTGSWRERSQACTQTQGLSGHTSQFPSARTPPQGPLRKFLGQRMGQVSPVECRMHWPHIRQSNMASLRGFSTATTAFSSRVVTGLSLSQRLVDQLDRLLQRGALRRVGGAQDLLRLARREGGIRGIPVGAG